LALKSSVKVFVGIPNLSTHDAYGGYLGSVLNHLQRQETTATLLPPFVTSNYAGKYAHGDDSRLYAIVNQMNIIVDKFVVGDATHLFINDGDVEIPPNCIDTLIKHDVDLASGVYPFKNFKHSRAMCFGRMKKDHPCGNMRPRDWDYMKGNVWGEEEPWTGGTGCMLIKRRVFKQYHPKINPLRFSKDEGCGMDMLFWKRVQDAGFTARVDANIVCGHLPNLPLSEIGEWLK